MVIRNEHLFNLVVVLLVLAVGALVAVGAAVTPRAAPRLLSTEGGSLQRGRVRGSSSPGPAHGGGTPEGREL